jgi:hypothetical protein
VFEEIGLAGVEESVGDDLAGVIDAHDGGDGPAGTAGVEPSVEIGEASGRGPDLEAGHKVVVLRKLIPPISRPS